MKRLLSVWVMLGCTSLLLRAYETLPLAGEWRFALDRADTGTNGNWFAINLPDKIKLPGILESQGYGDEISTATPWVLSLYDHFWFLRADYAAFTNAGRVKTPFISQPMRHYLGAAWYQRDIEIPPHWLGRRVVLFLERPHWKSTAWLDDQEIGSEISLCTPHEFELGVVAAPDRALHSRSIAPGKHRLTVRVDNRMILPYRPDAHSISDSLDQAWNGIAGKMELRATAPVWMEDLQLFPHLASNTITLKGKIGNATGQSGRGKVTIKTDAFSSVRGGSIDEAIPVSWDASGGIFETTLGATNSGTFPCWSEFAPNLRQLTARIMPDGDLTGDEKTITCGFRDFHAQGTQFILNGQPLYFRGTHFGGDFPLTGYPPTDTAAWTKIFLTCQDYGLNHMRFHSWCPPEAAFQAADELGFYLQVECGMWNEFSPGGAMEKMLYAETERILKAYGNHPSFLLLSASNEAHGHWMEVLPPWVEHFRVADPRRLYTPDTGWAQIQVAGHVTGADYLAGSRIGKRRQRNVGGWFGSDYGDSLIGIDVPVIAHELGQWCAYPDFAVIKKFTGFVQPGNFEIFRSSATAHGVLEQNHEFAHASGCFQLQCYKEEIEANLRTPGLAGFQLLDLHDYTGQGTALIGLLDPFWESKGYVTPDAFRNFCSPVVPLARLSRRGFTTADAFTVPVEIANFSARPLTNIPAQWSVLDAQGHCIMQGEFPARTIPIGKNFPLGTISLDLSKLPAPRQYTLAIGAHLESPHSLASLAVPVFHNTWKFWLYPEHISDASPAGVFTTDSWREAEKKLAAGGKVFLTPRRADLSWWSPPLARVPVFWNALMGPTWARHLGLWCDSHSPALAEFPTAAHCDWQWSELIHNARAVNLDHLPHDLKPIVSAIDDWNRNYKLGVIFEAWVGTGKLLVCTADLDSAPAGPQLRRSLLDYLAGDAFQPATAISPAEYASLFSDNLVMRKLGATATADGQPAQEILDGDPNTYWSSADSRGNGPQFPHEIQIHFPQPVALNGLLLMPRQNHREHQGDIRQFTLDASDDGLHWQALQSGQMASTFDPQTIPLEKTAATKHLKLTVTSGFGSDHSTALAELAIIYAGPPLPDVAGQIHYQPVRTASPDIDAGDSPVKKPGRR